MFSTFIERKGYFLIGKINGPGSRFGLNSEFLLKYMNFNPLHGKIIIQGESGVKTRKIVWLSQPAAWCLKWTL